MGVEEGGDGQRHDNIRTKDQANTNLIIRNNNMSEIEGDGILIDSTQGALIERNVLYNHSMSSAPQATAGIWSWNALNTTFRYNESYGGPIYNQDGCSYDADYWCSGNIFEYNYSHDTPMGFMLLMGGNESDIVRYNISQNDGVAWRHISGGEITPAYIYNNVFYYDGAKWKWSMTPIKAKYEFYNNIYYNHNTTTGTTWLDSSNTPFKWEDAKISNTIVYEASGNYADNGMPNALHVDPEFITPGGGKTKDWNSLAAYKVSNTSPAINVGAYVSIDTSKDENTQERPITTDFYNNPLYNGIPDIGVHEYEGADIPEKPLKLEGNGTYRIRTAMDQNYITVEADKSLKLTKVLNDKQKFVLSTIGDNYKIKCFDAITGEYGYLTVGTAAVTIEPEKTGDSQIFKLIDNKNGLVSISPVSDATKALSNESGNIALSTKANELKQQWFLDLVEASRALNVGGSTIEGFSEDRLFDEKNGALGRYGTVTPIDRIGSFIGKEEVYKTAVKGDVFGYKVQVPNEQYTVKLNFAEPEFETAGKRAFDILINGELVKGQYDIAETAGGKSIPVVEEIGFVYPKEGYIDVKLQATYAGEHKEPAVLNGISIEKTVATDVTMLFNSGGNIDADGMTKDKLFTENGSGYYDELGYASQSVSVDRPTPDGGMATVMETAREGESFGYKFKLAPRDYRVKLLFNDTLASIEGDRTFDIFINGSKVQSDFDIIKMAGGKQKTTALTFDAKPKNGYLDIQFRGTNGKTALVNAVLVEPYTDGIDKSKQVITPISVASSAQEDDQKIAPYAIDKNEATRWASGTSNGGKGHWLSVDLGKKHLIDAVAIDWTFGAYATKYSLEVSADGVNWKKIKQVDGAKPGLNSINFEPVEAQYVKVTAQEANDVWGISLYEMRVYGKEATGATTTVPTMEGTIGGAHTLAVGIKNIYKRYSTMSLELKYDPALVDYVGQEAYTNNKVKIVGAPTVNAAEGKVTYNFEITSQDAFDTQTDFIKTKFTAKTNERNFVQIKATLSDPAAHLTQLPLTKGFINNDITKAMLQALIHESQAFANAAQVGNAPGLYKQETVDTFKNFITSVQQVHDKEDATTGEFATAYQDLVDKFELFKIDVIKNLYETYYRDYSEDSYTNDYTGTNFTVGDVSQGALNVTLQANGKMTNQLAKPLKDGKLKVKFSVDNVSDQLKFNLRDKDGKSAQLTIDGASTWVWEDSTEGGGWGNLTGGTAVTMKANTIYELTIDVKTIDAQKSKMSVWLDNTFIGEKTTSFKGIEAGTFSIGTRRQARTLKIYEIAYTDAPQHIITATAEENGSISKMGAIKVYEEMNKTFIFTPNKGFVVDTVTVDGVPVTITDNKYIFEFITQDHTLKATFKRDPAAIKTDLVELLVKANKALTDAVVGTHPGEYRQEDIDTFRNSIAIAQAVYDNTLATQEVLQTAYTDLEESFKTFKGSVIIEPYIGYYKNYAVDKDIPNYSGNNVTVSSEIIGDVLKLGLTQSGTSAMNEDAPDLSGTMLFKMKFSLDNTADQIQFRIQDSGTSKIELTIEKTDWVWGGAMGGAWGKLTPTGPKLEPNTIYELKMKVEPVDATKSKLSVWLDGTFIGEHTDVFPKVAGKFAIWTRYTPKNLTIYEIAYTNAPEYIITASAGSNGTLSESGKVVVYGQTDRTFTFTPNEGYEVDVVKVDGKEVTNVGNSYTFTSIKRDHRLEVSFKQVIPDIKGSYTVRYKDEAGVEVAIAKEVVDLALGNYTENAQVVTGYELVGERSRTITLTEQVPNVEIAFIYKKVEVIRPMINKVEATNGEIKVYFNNGPEILELAEVQTFITINKQVEKSLAINSFVYDKDIQQAEMTFKPLVKQNMQQTVILAVVYEGNKVTSNSFTLTAKEDDSNNDSSNDSGSNSNNSSTSGSSSNEKEEEKIPPSITEQEDKVEGKKELTPEQIKKEELVNTAKETVNNILKPVSEEVKVIMPEGIHSSHWAYESMKFAIEKEIIKGDEKETFKPAEKVTRADTAKYIGRILGLSQEKTGEFYKDVAKDAEYATYVEALNILGIMKGIGQECFNPEGILTREQVASIVVRTYETLVEKEIDIRNEKLRFKDKDISTWAVIDIKKAQKLGIIKGVTEENFMPKQETSHAEVMVMLERLVQLVASKEQV